MFPMRLQSQNLWVFVLASMLCSSALKSENSSLDSLRSAVKKVATSENLTVAAIFGVAAAVAVCLALAPGSQTGSTGSLEADSLDEQLSWHEIEQKRFERLQASMSKSAEQKSTASGPKQEEVVMPAAQNSMIERAHRYLDSNSFRDTLFDVIN